MWENTKSLQPNVVKNIYSHMWGFNHTYQITKAIKYQVAFSLSKFIHNFGDTDHLKFDGAEVQTGSNMRFVNNSRRDDIKYLVLLPKTPNENLSESIVIEVKRRRYCMNTKRKVPCILWYFGLSCVFDTGNVTVSSSIYDRGTISLEFVIIIMPEITE